MSIPSEAERLAGYRESMAKTLAGAGKPASVNTNWAPGSGALQTEDSARRIYEMSQRKVAAAQVNAMSPAEIIQADAAGRAIARQQAKLAGINLPDYDLQVAGRKMVQSKAEQQK